MNTRNRPGRCPAGVSQRRRAPFGLGTVTKAMPLPPNPRPLLQTAGRSGFLGAPPTSQLNPACSTESGEPCRHPLTDVEANERLLAHEQALKKRFGVIVPTLKRIAAEQHQVDFVERAQEIARAEFGFELPERLLAEAWTGTINMRVLYGEAVLRTMRLIAEQVRISAAGHGSEADAAVSFFLDCGYHAVDISPCSDGRLKGLLRYMLRLPDGAVRTRNAYAGAMFDVEENVRRWTDTELIRYREARPVGPDADTRYLKIAIYHWSSSNPTQMGCAAHGNNEREAADAVLRRMRELREAIDNRFSCGASVDLLLIGVDTDTDAIKVHVPDGDGELSPYRAVDNLDLYRQTVSGDRNGARLKVYQAIRKASAATGWGAGNGEPHEGIRKLIATLLINNLSQIEYVCGTWGGRYPDIGHAENFISVGDGFEEFQLRNVAYFAHLRTLEEATQDMDVGVKIFEKLNLVHGLPVVIAVHFRYDSQVPGSRQRMVERCRRVRSAIGGRYLDLTRNGLLVCGMTVQDTREGSPLEVVEALDDDAYSQGISRNASLDVMQREIH